MATAGTIRNLRQKFSAASMLMKIIVVNIAFFLVMRIAASVLILSGNEPLVEQMLNLVQMPSAPGLLLTHPWTVITYMFAQYDVLHLLFNMLWLYWFGIVFNFVSTSKQLLALYIYGGIAGALLFMVAYNVLPFFTGHIGYLIGSSAGVIAIVTATAILMPDYRFNLLFLGPVSLKWVAIVTIGLDLIGITGANAGGHIAHLGGAVAGAWYGLSMRRGTDITAPLNGLIDRIVNLVRRLTSLRIPKRRPQERERRPQEPRETQPSPRPRTSAEDQEILDSILDKIKKSGYTSLTPEERKRLFDVSKRIS